MKDLLKYAIILPICLYGQAAYSTFVIDSQEKLYQSGMYDNDTQIKQDITLAFPDHEGKDPYPVSFSGRNIVINGKNNTIYGGKTKYMSGFDDGTGFAFRDGTNATIKNLNLTNFTHRQRGTLYVQTSTGIFDNITMTGYRQEIDNGNIWGSMVALVNGSLDNIIRNSTFQNINLKLRTPDGAATPFDLDGGVLHVQGNLEEGQSTASILNSKFLNNKVESNRKVFGGAVYNEGVLEAVSGSLQDSQLTSQFKENSIKATGEFSLKGLDAGQIDRQRTIFGGFGGAFSLGSHNTDRGNATIKLLSYTLFEGNSVTTADGYARGGALWSGPNSVIDEIRNCTFKDNKSVSNTGKASGGAIFNNGSIAKIVGSTFTGNSVESPNEFKDLTAVQMTSLTGAGGAIFTRQDMTIQEGTTFSNNSVNYVIKDNKGVIDPDKTIVVGNDIHLSVNDSGAADLFITKSAPDADGSVSILSGIASKDSKSTITVQDGATLNLSGVNKYFTGQTNIKGGSTLNYTQTAQYLNQAGNLYLDSFLNGTVNIAGSSSVNASTVNFNNVRTETVKDLTGAGIFNKTGAGTLIIEDSNNTNESFTGLINLENGSLTVYTAPQLAESKAAGNTNFNANIGAGTTFTYNNGGWGGQDSDRDDKYTLDSNFKLKFNSKGTANSNSTLNFKGHGTFKVLEDILNAEGNNITIDSTTTSFATNNYDANYTLTNSTINQQDNEINNVVFTKNFSTKSDEAYTIDVAYNIDFDFSAKDGLGDADKLLAENNTGSAIFRLSAINVLKDGAGDVGLLVGTPQRYKILSGASFYDSWRTIDSDIYTYEASTENNGTDLILKATEVKTDALYNLNHTKKADNRYFYLLGTNEYHIGQDLQGTLAGKGTNAGNLYVNGTNKINNIIDPSANIITGDGQYSFFQNNENDAANLFVNNVTLQDGLGKGIATVLDVNKNYTASFDNVVIKDNVTNGGLASAISNNGGTIKLKNVAFSNNTGAESYIYNSGTENNSGTMNFEITNNGTSIEKYLTNGAIGADGNKITNDTYGIMNFVTGGNTYTINSAIDNNGTINITNGSTVALTNNYGVRGSINGIVDVQGNLQLKDNTSDIFINSGFSGGGNITKYDSLVANITGDNSGFEGNVNILGGTLNFSKTETNNFFSDDATITVDNAANKGSTLDYTTAQLTQTLNSTNISLQNGGTYIFSGRTKGDSVVTLSNNIVNSDTNSNNLIFQNADYIIGSNAQFYYKTAGSPDNITFKDAEVRFIMDDNKTAPVKPYDMGNANWTLDNSEFRFLNMVAGDEYKFKNLTMNNNSKMSLDLDLTLDKANRKKPYADTFTAEGGNGGVVEIIRVGITADNGEFYENLVAGTNTHTLSKGKIQVFTDPGNKLRVANVNNAVILNWGTNVYKYGIEAASSELPMGNGGKRQLDSIEVVPEGASDTDTLRDLNRYEIDNAGGNRGFSFIVTEDKTGNKHNEYHIYRDLDTTSEGAFSIIGTVDEEAGKSVLDGTLKDVVTTVLGSYEKLKENKVDGEVVSITYDDTTISADSGLYTSTVNDKGIREYTIKPEAFVPEGSGQTQGSMFEIENVTDKFTDFYMSDVVVQNAKRYASDNIDDGSVIYVNNTDATITLENVDVKNNSTEIGNGGAIANIKSDSFRIENMKADNNTAGGLGGAIYTAANMNIIDSDFGTALNENGTYALNRDENGQNDIYIAGVNTELDYNVSAVDKTTTINSGIAGDGQFVKTGEGTLNLNGKNSALTGLFAVDAGKVLYTKDSDTDSFATGSVRINGELEMDIEKVVTGTSTETLTETITNISSDTNNGKLTKSGEGILNLTGDNSGFSGSININEGSVSFTSDNNNSYIDGKTNIAQSAALDYIANTESTLKNVSGLGKINYSGTSDLTFNAADNFNAVDNTGFTGVVNANGKQLNVLGKGTNAFDFGINIQSGILNYTAADGAKLTLNNDSKVAFADDTTGAEAIFGGVSSEQSTYTVGNIANVSGNTVTFDNTTVKLSENTYTDGSYKLQNNAILNLKDNKINEVSFNSLSSISDANNANNGKLSLDVDLGPLSENPVSDVLNVANGSGTLTLSSINVLNEKTNRDDGLHPKYTFDVIKGENNSLILGDSPATWATSVYVYDVNVNTSKKGIIMTALKATDADSLKEMNEYEGRRGFQFTTDDTNPYTIGSDLGITEKGIFTVKGVKDGNTVTVISGGSGDNKHSFFDVQKETQLTINDVTITNAKTNSEGSVINAANSAASIVLNNVTLQGNEDKNGKNDIYIAQGASVSANDSAINSGLSGNGTFNADNSTLSGKNDNFTGVLNVTGDKGLTFSQTDAIDSYIKGTTNVGTSSLTLNIDKGNTIAGNFTGTGTLNKEGKYTAAITGDNSKFKGDVNINKGTIAYNADDTIYFAGNTILSKDGSLKVSTNNGTELSKISGNGTLSKDGNGTLTLTGNNSEFNGNLHINNGIFALAAGSTVGEIANGIFENNTAINLQNTVAVKDSKGSWITSPNPGSFHNLEFNKLTLNGNVGLNIDVDLKNTIADTIAANTVSGYGHLILGAKSLNVVSDSLLKDTTVRIASGAVAKGNTIILSNDAKSVMGPIQKYDVTYANGNLGFSRQGGNNPSVDSVNPSVMASPVSTQVGGYLTQLQTLQDGFFHMDKYTKFPSAVRLAAERNNKYAVTESPVYSKSPLAETSQAMWTKPYTAFESVHLKGGINVSTTTYGSLYGGDTDLVDMGHGFKGVISTFVGYNGSQQSYNGISISQNGGSLGVTGTLYKGNFFTGLTASTGASTGDAYTYYGHDNFSMLTAGIANKTGYNWEINEGKLIVQPSVFMGYTFVNTFDYTNCAGVKIDSDPLNAITLAPGVKFIGNLNNGWQPYAGVDMVWNIMDKTNVKANDVRLPQLSVKPYVQYGVGVQKSWGERFTAFFQTMIRNGGRSGVVLTGGFRWAIGKKEAPSSSNEPVRKKYIKKPENL